MRTVGVCGCSICCCPSAARSVISWTSAVRRMSRIADAARASGLRAVWLTRRLARASLCRVLRQAARVRLARARPSSTTHGPGHSFVRGRSVVGAGSRGRPRHSLRGRRRARVDGLVPVPGDPERAWQRGDVPARGLATELARACGTFRSSTSSSEVAHFLASADSPSTSGAATSRKRRSPAPRSRRASASWTTSTRPARPSTLARRRADGPERACRGVTLARAVR